MLFFFRGNHGPAARSVIGALLVIAGIALHGTAILIAIGAIAADYTLLFILDSSNTQDYSLRAGAAALCATPAIAQDNYDGRIGTGLECVPYARQMSGIQIYGNAWTWWEQASERYEEGSRPQVGAVLVFRPHGVMKLGHVVVRPFQDRIQEGLLFVHGLTSRRPERVRPPGQRFSAPQGCPMPP